MATSLFELLKTQREKILGSWKEALLHVWPENAARFMVAEKDPFQNPMGETVRRNLPVLLEGILEGTQDSPESRKAADELAGLLAVREGSPSEALAFVPALRRVILEVVDGCRPESEPDFSREERELQERLDGLILLLFDSYAACRERLYSIRAEEARRSVYLLKRMHPLPEEEKQSPAEVGPAGES